MTAAATKCLQFYNFMTSEPWDVQAPTALFISRWNASIFPTESWSSNLNAKICAHNYFNSFDKNFFLL